MAITTYASRGNAGSSVLSKPTGTTQSILQNSSSNSEKKNRGGIFGAAAYLLEKNLASFVEIHEGAADYTFAGLAKLFGRDDWAESIIENDWFGDWYTHADRWYNPGEGMQVAGAVASGIGTSAPGMGVDAIVTYFTGSKALGAAASTFAVGLGAAGRATKEAYEKTGQLTGKEFGYGALSGLSEGAIEGASSLIGTGGGAVVKNVVKALGKETGESFAKQGIKTLASSFFGEAFEEGLSEYLDPYWKRLTYDPKAENATADEVIYAGLVGGLSGMVMGGGGYVIDSANSYSIGNKLSISGGDTEVLETSGYFSDFEESNHTGDEIFSEIVSKRKTLLESLQKTGGKAVTMQQKRELGALSRANVAAGTKMFVAREAQNIVNNADVIAQRLTAYGYKSADGKPIRYTAEEITKGYDPKRPETIYSAIQNNEKLRTLAVSSATGRLMMDTNQFMQATLAGERLASQVDINRFYETASKEEIRAVSKALGIDSWSSLTPEIFNQKIADFLVNGGAERSIEQREKKAAFASLASEGASPIPKAINLADGIIRRFSDGQLDVAVERKGRSYSIYNYDTDTLSKEMTVDEVNGFFRDYTSRMDEYAEARRSAIEEEQRRITETREIDTLLRESVADYKNLNAPNQSMIRRLVREGRAKGISDSDLLMYAKVSAHSGIDIQFDKEANYRGVKKDGTADYADGFYEAAKNRIVVNPEGKRTAERLLIHELDHAIRKYFDSEGKPATRIYLDAIEGVDQATRDRITEAYKKTAKPGEVAATIMDETNAYYAEQVLGNKYTLEKLIEADPTLKDKILSFFKSASTDYADVPKLSGAAKKYYRTYKKLFDEFSARNAQSNANENTLTSINHENMQVSNITDASKAKSYTYEALTNKKDIPIVTLSTTIPKTSDGKIDKKAIIAQGKQNARNQNNPNNTDTSTYVHVDDIGVDVLLGAKGLQHGLARSEETAYAVMKIGDILKTSVAVNEMNGSTERNTEMSYVLLGACQDNDNLYVVRSVVSKLSNDVTEIDIYQLGAVKGKKTKTPNSALKRGAAVTEQGSLISSGSSVISISDLIQYVKDIPMINEVLSEDVAKKLGVTRSKGTLSGSLRYALDIETVDREYSSAVERGDMETAQRMVDEAAEKWSNGNALMTMDAETGEAIFQFYRSSDGNRTVWDGHGNNQAKGVFLTTNKYVARAFDPDRKYITVFAKANKPFEIDAKGQIYTAIPVDENSAPAWLYNMSSSATEWNDSKNDYVIVDYVDIDNLYPEAFKQGYDAVIVKNVKEGVGGNPATDIVLKDGGTQMKSADPVTYDDNGRVIPLSERFNERNPDIRYALDIDSEGENISGAEVMSWLNDRPKGDGKLDLEATVARGLPYKRGKSSLTVGEIRKVIANTTHEKVYSKGEAMKVVKKLSGTWGLTQRARDEIADTVWQFLNEAPDVEYRRDMAHDIAEYIVAKVLMDSKTENPDALEAAERLSFMRTGIGKISFSEQDIAEIRHAVDQKGLKRIMGRWGFKGTKKAEGVSGGYVATRRIPMDIFVTDVAREMPGMSHLEEMHPAEAFLEIDRAYSRAYADSKDKWISRFWDMPDSEIPSMIKDVEDGIMSAFDVFGEKSKFRKQVEARIESYQKRAERFKAERDEIKGRDRILGLLMSQATKMKNLKMGTYANATQHDSDVLRGSVERLARIQFRGNLNVSGTRQIISELRLWYNPKNSMLEYVDEQNPGYYSKAISNMLDALADGEGGFAKEDLLTLYDVMAYFTNFVENYGKVWRKGQWVDAEAEAKRYVNTLQTNSELKVSPVSRLIGSRYMQTFGDPMTVARRMDMYDSGFFTEMLEELREGAMGAQIAEMEILSDYDKFLTENRKYIEKAATERIIYQGVEVPKMQLIGLYMTLKRRHSRPGLAQNGFSFIDTDGKKVRVNGFAMVKDITEAEIDKRSEEQIALIASKLTDTDKQYIKILEKAYNEDARRLKAERDIQRLGFTNAGMGYYYPIRRGNIAKNIDSSDYMAELDRVSNSSFNKNTVKGARQELYIENADVVFRRHVRAVTQYSYMSPAIEAYNRLYNLDVGGNPNHPISVATESANVWDRGNAYFKKLIADIQGIPATSGEGEEMLAKIRGGYAKYQLGANPKVWFTQLSSLFASTSKLDADSIVKGASVSAEGLDKYCPLAKLRSSENTAAIAQAVLDTRGKRVASGMNRVSDALMAPIGKMDRFVVGRLFAACQVQIEKDGGAKVGTEQNKIDAGELLTQVILETQQNSIATERSAAMRSGSEIIRTATMFTSDSMKVTGRVVDAYGEALSLKAKIKAESDTTKRAELEKRLKTVNTKLNKSLGAMVGSAVYMACVAQLFRWLYNKEEDEDKSTFETMFFDTLGNMLGGLPFVKDVYSKLFEGYDVDNYAYSAINDLISSAGNFMELGSKAIAGDLTAEERNRGIRNLVNSVGQVTGMPTRNIYNVLYGMTKRFSPTAAFVVDSWFYEKNYQNELNKAIERGDNKTASYILSVIMGERFDENIDEQVFNEILNLTAAGYKVLPKLMPDSVSFGDVDYILSDGEREAMRKVYSESEPAIKALVESSYYSSFTDEEKAKAVDYISDLYYDKASSEVLGTESIKAVTILKAISADKLAAYYVKTRGIASDVDDNGNTISGSKRAKVVQAISSLGVSVEERLLLICASGYALKDGDVRGLSAEGAKTRLLKYILKYKGLSADERLALAEMCGFEVKNGRIVNNFSKNLKKLSKK